MNNETQEMLFGRVVFSRPVNYEKPDFIVRYEERHKEFNRMNEFYVLKNKLMKRRIRTIKNP
ncbi:hypothetical protein PIL02S_03346 [Paenibacillus illinoisensis]|uniref:Uncharacterized protein n=1 Tax=Paenibacillus illinoisensis TaxID=59845 RepID=A0A2W0C6W9_9BACL|nr:hypothetical protein PIL02S_03346 [Paenibacillus illinoisensis]